MPSKSSILQKKKALEQDLNSVKWSVFIVDEKSQIVNKQVADQDILKLTVTEVERVMKCDKTNFVSCKHLESYKYTIKVCSSSIASSTKILRGKRGQGIYNYPASIVCFRPVFGTAAFLCKNVDFSVQDLYIIVKNTIGYLQEDSQRMKMIPMDLNYRKFIKHAINVENNRTNTPTLNVTGTESTSTDNDKILRDDSSKKEDFVLDEQKPTGTDEKLLLLSDTIEERPTIVDDDSQSGGSLTERACAENVLKIVLDDQTQQKDSVQHEYSSLIFSNTCDSEIEKSQENEDKPDTFILDS